MEISFDVNPVLMSLPIPESRSSKIFHINHIRFHDINYNHANNY